MSGTAPRTRARAATAIWALASAAYVALVLAVTLAPMPWANRVAQPPRGVLGPDVWARPGTWTTGSSTEFMLNVALFVPVGLLAARFGVLPALLASLAASLSIEVAQIPMPDRVSDPRDLVANVLGGVVGALALRATRSPAPSVPPVTPTR